jgi:60 kDa SS-A/Ro ribonucleoprotein
MATTARRLNMLYAKLFNKKMTHQSQPIPGSGQVPNSAGGYAWQLDKWGMLDRFLILGSEGGTYYIKERKLTEAHAENVLAAIREDGLRAVARIVAISEAGRAPKNDPAIFALALAASFGDEATRQAAFEALPRVCRTGTHLFGFVEACDGLRGWGRGLRKAVGRWYASKSPAELEYQLVKYQRRGGWSHADLLRLAHPKPTSDELSGLFRWAVDLVPQGAPLIEAMQEIKGAKPADAARLIRERKLPREAVPTELLAEPAVWEALLGDMPMTAMIRNLANMTKAGLLTPMSDSTRVVIERLGDQERLRKARVHPVAVLLAHATYASGRGLRGGGAWEPVPRIVDALDDAFYLSFGAVEPTQKRYLLGLDVSGSMSWSSIAGVPLTPAQGAAAMAMTTLRTESRCEIMGFATTFRSLGITPKMRLSDVLSKTSDLAFGGTDCALPMLYALKRKLEVDVFVVYTDNETWFGKIHPVQALARYRNEMGINAKLIVVGMAANNFTIADPKDAGMLDVVGFDATVPQAISAFVA